MSFMFLLFGFILFSLGLGLLLGWLIWCYDNDTEDELSSLNSKVNFWRQNLDHCRLELSTEKDATALLRDERTKLKDRIKALEKALLE